jgi:hypothetical protein
MQKIGVNKARAKKTIPLASLINCGGMKNHFTHHLFVGKSQKR